MPGEKSELASLRTRKQLLLLESDLNRAHLIEAVGDVKSAVHHVKEHLSHMGSMASFAVPATRAAAGVSAICAPAGGAQANSRFATPLGTFLKSIATWATLTLCAPRAVARERLD